MSVGDLVCDVSGVYWAWCVIAGILLLYRGRFVVLEWRVVSVMSMSVVVASLCSTYGLAGGCEGEFGVSVVVFLVCCAVC